MVVKKLLSYGLVVFLAGISSLYAKQIEFNLDNLAEGVNKIYYNVSGEIHVGQGEKASLKIEINDLNKDYLDISKNDNSLYINLKKGGRQQFPGYWSRIKPKIYLTVTKRISNFVNSSYGEALIKNINAGNLEVRNSSYGKTIIENIKCKELIIKNTSVGCFECKGLITAGDINVKITSGGAVNVDKMNGDNLDIKNTSSGSFTANSINMSNDFSALISSTGNINIEKLEAENIEVDCTSSGNFNADMLDGKQKSFDIKNISSGDIKIENINCDNVKVKINSNGDVNLSGKTNDLNVELNSSGSYNGRELVAEKGDLRNSSSGTVRANIQKKLDLRSSGSGDIYIKGKPEMNINQSGSGRFVCEDNNFNV